MLFENILIIFAFCLFMPRNRTLRKINAPPRFGGYKPYGCPLVNNEPVNLLYEEYEAIKLADYKLMNHNDAAILMGISRATFARIYEKARRKIALALVETREISTKCGSSFTEKEWFECKKCHARFTMPANIGKEQCPLCKSTQIKRVI